MSDREAFVQAIAANPADDLPRLVFADWLDEHGEPERAEFIRTQIRWHHADADERKSLDARAEELFKEHWQRWFAPLLLALDPDADRRRNLGIKGNILASKASLSMQETRQPGSAVQGVDVIRGFTESASLDLTSWAEQASLAEAFRMEPLTELICQDGLHSPVWSRFTQPALRWVTDLRLNQRWAWGVSAPESTALLEDPHLAGVRMFSLHADMPNSDRLAMIPAAWVDRFTRSPLAYRLSKLRLWTITADGIGALCRPGRLRLEGLCLSVYPLTTDVIRQLGGSELGQTLAGLSLRGLMADGEAAALTREEWPQLRSLDLSYNRLTAAVLPALAAAAFTPRLEWLDLSHMPLFDATTDVNGLHRLADALDPERVRELNLTDTGLSAVPDFLAERFGDRVTV